MNKYFENNFNYFIIIEYFPFGDLENLFKQCKILSEELIAMIFKQLFSAISYLHSNNIIHRDIKLKNILVQSYLETNPLNISIKLTDFGSSNYLFKGESLMLKIGFFKALLNIRSIKER